MGKVLKSKLNKAIERCKGVALEDQESSTEKQGDEPSASLRNVVVNRESQELLIH